MITHPNPQLQHEHERLKYKYTTVTCMSVGSFVKISWIWSLNPRLSISSASSSTNILMPLGSEEKDHICVMKAFAKTKDKIKASFCAYYMNEPGCAVLGNNWHCNVKNCGIRHFKFKTMFWLLAKPSCIIFCAVTFEFFPCTHHLPSCDVNITHCEDDIQMMQREALIWTTSTRYRRTRTKCP